MENKRNLLVTLADRNYLHYAKQLFSSVYWNAGWKGDYMLLAHEIPGNELEWFTNKGILVKRCKPLYDQNIGKENYPPVVLNIFYLFTPEFRQWKNIIFLDGDIIVRASLDTLTKDRGFASPRVIGDLLKYYFYDDTDPVQFAALNSRYNLNVPAFNCGVMAFSSDIIREDILPNLMQILDTYRKVSSGSDPTLNQFFYKKWKKLSILYDVTPEKIEQYTGIAATKVKGIIIHLKDNELSDKNNTFYQEWKKNLEKAEFIDLNNIPKGEKWNVFKKVYYGSIIRIKYQKRIIAGELKSFSMYKIKPFFLYIIFTPDRLLGKMGLFIKKNNPGLYKKLKK